MKTVNVCLVGFVFVVGAWAEPLLEGRVRLESGEPVADAQVRLFDLTDLRQGAIARAQTDGRGYFALPLAALRGSALPEGFSLGPNYPNPFNPSTIIPYQLAALSEVRLEVFNLLGQRIATLVDGERPAGFHTATWHATDAAGRAVAAGVYIYRMTIGEDSQTGRMVLIDGQAGMPAAGSGRSAAAVEAAGEAAPIYGLTVSGPGLVPLVDPAFQRATDRRPVELVVEAPGSIPRAKVTAKGILGDVDNNGQVDFSDALLVALYSQDASIILPNPGAISLGDVNADGQVDLADAGLLGAYLNDPSDLALPAGLGKRVSSATASLSPDPSTVSFADDGIWHRFTVQASEPVLVVVNPGATTPRLELTTRSGRGNYCPGGADDDASREDGETIYLAGCAAGTAMVELRQESDDTVLQTYTFTVTGNPADLVVESASVSASSLTPGQSFTLSATVSNEGTAESPATTLGYYRSTNATISTQDTQVGTDGLDGLAPLATTAESISLTAPSDVGTYYYGACVERASGESAGNNCSTGIRVIVKADETSEEEGADGPVVIPDAKLRAAIEAALGKAKGATITKAEMETLTTLETSNAGISDLTGLEFATNLPTLSLSAHNLTNISALSGLTNLWWLSLSGFSEISPTSISAFSDISALSGLTNLTYLYLGHNRIRGISALSGLTNLTHLYLGSNGITDFSALSGLTNLTYLSLSDNGITDISALISALSGLTNLTELDLRGIPLSVSSINDHIPALQARGITVRFDPTPVTIIDDPTPVTIPDAKLRAAIAAELNEASDATITKTEMSILRHLWAYDAGISDLTGLEFATNLTILQLGENRIADVSALRGLTKLTELGLWGNNITDISALSGLTKLTQLWLDDNNITDISALSGLTKLTELELWGNNITDISALSGLTKLTILRLGNNITDISALSGLTKLTWLHLGDNEITDISALSGLTDLTELNLGGNEIMDISALSGLTKLTWLGLGLNNISDISAFSGLTNLTELDLKGIPLSVSSINDHIPALQARGVTVRFDPPFRESDFDIELVFLDDHFTEKQKRIFRYAARRWMSIIRKDLPDYKFTQGWSGNCGDQPYEIPSGERIDDLRIYVGSVERMDEVRIHVANEEVVFESRAYARPDLLRETFLPVLGCVTVNSKFFDSFSSIDFLGMSLHEMGHVLGIGTTGFRESGFLRDSSDGPYFNGPRAIAAFDEAGGRNYTGAKVPIEKSGGHWRSPVLEGELMSSRRGISMLSAITIQALADLGYVVDVTQADSYTLPRTAAKPSAKVTAHSTHAQSEWSCGVGEQQEPIYVVDQQGRIVRTISP